MYRICSDLVVGRARGDVVDDDDLVGANVPALIEAGHLEPIEPDPDQSEED